MNIDPHALMTSVRLMCPDGECVLIESKNNRFMIQVSVPPAFVVIEHDGMLGIGLSRVRTHAESWLAGHEIVLEEARPGDVMQSLAKLLSEPEHVESRID